MYDIMFEKCLNPNFDIEFKREDNQIIALHKGMEYRFEKESLSLKTIAETTNMKPMLYVTKPKELHKDYNEMLQSLTEQIQKGEKKSFQAKRSL
jgi:hypothetical protein